MCYTENVYTEYVLCCMCYMQGLLPAMDELLKDVDHIFCVRHLYNNFRKQYPGKKLKELMWKAAKATYPNAWMDAMKEIKAINPEAFEHLIQIPPRRWSRSYFRVVPKCDTLVNNMSESFSSVIVGPRSKPVITVLEEIRIYIMERWEKNRHKIQIYPDSILPNIKKKLEREAVYTNKWLTRYVYTCPITLIIVLIYMSHFSPFLISGLNQFVTSVWSTLVILYV